MNPRIASLLILTLSIALVGCGAASDASPSANDGASKGSGPAATAAKGEIGQALADAKAAGKNVLVEYTSKTCPYCKQMEKTVFASSVVKDALSEKVVHVRIVQEEDGSEFEERWGKQPTPTFVALDASGKQIGTPVSGALATGDFLSFVRWAADGSGPQPGVATGGS